MTYKQQKDYTHLYVLWGAWVCAMMIFVNIGVLKGWSYQFFGRSWFFGNPIRGLIIVGISAVVPLAFSYAAIRKVSRRAKEETKVEK